MDAHAKRFLWSRVVNVVSSGCSVLLTSHSMEECEALCTRVAIMVKGRLHCIGTPQFIKSKYGDGYTLVLKCAASVVDCVHDAVQESFVGTTLVESHRGYCRFIVPTKSALPLSATFQKLLVLKGKFSIEHFTISQTSLEDVFLKFSSPDLEASETEAGLANGGVGLHGNSEDTIRTSTSEREEEVANEFSDDDDADNSEDGEDEDTWYEGADMAYHTNQMFMVEGDDAAVKIGSGYDHNNNSDNNRNINNNNIRLGMQHCSFESSEA
jgi:hypothetical protein